MLSTVEATVEPVRWPAQRAEVVQFLSVNRWPFHGVSLLSPGAARDVAVAGDDVASFWLCADRVPVGLIRLLDLDDIHHGSPRFDVRIAEAWRGRGLGTFAVTWLTDHLFETFPSLHRIEATTREDNAAMQIVLGRCGYRLEGRFVEAWPVGDGSFADALSSGILRREWESRRP